MNPVKHPTRAIRPIPVEAERGVVVLTLIHRSEIEVRPTSFRFPRSPACSAGCREEVAKRLIATELGTVLSKALINTIFAGEKPTQVCVSAADGVRVTIQHVHGRYIRFTLRSDATIDNGEFSVTVV